MIDLHAHLGGGVPAPVLWEIGKDKGIPALTDYNKFQEFMTASGCDLKEFLSYFHTTELIQRGVEAVERCVYEMVAKSYRRSRLKHIEIRFNPTLRTYKDENAEMIVEAALRGGHRAMKHYPVSVGIILITNRIPNMERQKDAMSETCSLAMEFGADRRYDYDCRVVGVDVAALEDEHEIERAELFKSVFGHTSINCTYHIGETCTAELTAKVIDIIKTPRIGHGIGLRHFTEEQLAEIKHKPTLEICPVVNEVCGLASIHEIADFCVKLYKAKWPFCLNTDNPYMVKTDIAKTYTLMSKHLTDKVLKYSFESAESAIFR
jgi:adenosine deaminase